MAYRLLAIILLSYAANSSAYAPCDPDVTKGTFLQNFLNWCFAIPLSSMSGSGGPWTDSDALYHNITYRALPGFELVFIGEFPRARYMGMAVYGDHLSTSAALSDLEIEPLEGSFNPFRPGAEFADGQFYGVVVGLGGTRPVLPPTGCRISSAIEANRLDGGRRHTAPTWEGRAPPFFPPHEGPDGNDGGSIVFRQYLAEGGGTIGLRRPVVIVRDATTGCAVPRLRAVWVERVVSTGQPALQPFHVDQISWHVLFRRLQPRWCYGDNPDSELEWLQTGEYVTAPHPHAFYVLAIFPQAIIPALETGERIVRIRVQLPPTPRYPCHGCIITGEEDLRYWSLSFMSNDQNVISISDAELTLDGQRFATALISYNGSFPPHVDPSSYTLFDVSHQPHRLEMDHAALRTVLARDEQVCGANRVPLFTTEHNDVGGFMGSAAPVVDFPLTSEVPPAPLYDVDFSGCGIEPREQPFRCGLASPY